MDGDSEIPEGWKELIDEEEIKKVAIETIRQWMGHPKKDIFINWKNDSAIGSGRTMLNCAIRFERLDIAKLLLEHGADLNIVNKFGYNSLLSASENGRPKIVELLLENGADLSIANKNGGTALLLASCEGHIKIVELLVANGADLNLANMHGDTPLIGASEWGHTNIAELLLDKGADINVANKDGYTVLMYASSNGRTKIVKLLLDKGAKVNSADNFGYTALMSASEQGHTKIVQLLLEKDADINITKKNGDTAWILASRGGYTNMLELLLDKGADMNSADKNGDTALILAAIGGHTNAVELLLDKGTDFNIANKHGDTALTLAAVGGHSNMVELLLEKGSDPSVCNSNGQTSLHRACLQNQKANAEQLLKIGTDKDKIDDNGHTALFYAAEKGFVDIIELLKIHNADVNKTDERRLIETTDPWGRSRSGYSVKDGRTPLFVAAQNGHLNAVASLLQHGADPYLCNNESRIPSEISAVHGPIQQLFRIQDFFDRREQGDAYKKTYITCEELPTFRHKRKKPVPRLKDIIHDIVKYPHFADKFLELYLENREIVNFLDKDGRTVQQVACRECREVVLFLRQYDLEDKPIYESPTCKIYNALDYGGPNEPSLKNPRRVAMKFIAKAEHFENEMGARQKDDGTARFSSEFVIPHLAAYRADRDEKYGEACRTWKTNGTETGFLPGFCVVMERGERSLLEAMNAENLSAKHKDLERRDILQKLCKIFSYLHDMGYVHGDIKPHNVVRQMGQNATWKAIDFDACTRIGDEVGLKLTTGSAPPEMLKIIKSNDANTESTGESKVILRQPRAGLDESDLVLADPSFDVWSYGILMYQLLTGRSFFHCDLQGNVDDAGLEELAALTERRIHKKLVSVEDVNARVLLSRILHLDPNERPTMSEVGQDYYFHPSESPQGRKAEFFGKQVFSVSVPEASQTSRAEKDGISENSEDISRFLSSKAEFSYFKLRDEDKDWSDKLLNSEVETFHFDKLEGMGEKPLLIDGDTIYQNNFLRGLLSSKGPDYFMGFLVEYFELYKIMNDAHEVCQEIKANLVSDVKSLKGIFIKLFVRGKGLNDIVRGTLFCNSINQFKYVGRQLKERYGHNVYIKPPKNESGAWPIPKLLIYGKKQIDGRCMSVEIQFSTVYMHLAAHASNNHLVYEAMRESTGYLIDKDKEFLQFLRSLNQQYIDTEGFLRNESAQEGRFEILVEQAGETDTGGESRTSQEESDKQYTTKATPGFILSGRIRCGDYRFRFMSPKDHFQRFSESSFVVNKNLTLLSSHSYWSDEPYDLEGEIVEFVVSFKGRGLAIAGIGTSKCLHGTTSESGDHDEARCSVHVGRSKFVVRRSGVEEVFREKKFPNQARAKIRFQMVDGVLSVSFVGGSNEEQQVEEVLEMAQVSLPSDKRYYLYMRAPPGVHDVKFHEVSIRR